MKPSDVLDKSLQALKDVKVQTAPAEDGGKVIGYLRKGMVSPPVWSYLVRGKKVYWVFDYSIPGGPQNSYVVLHASDRFKLIQPWAVTKYQLDTGSTKDAIPDTGGFFDDIKKVALYGGLGLAALLIITSNK